jgi:DUF2075 family protein/Cdc6-like AAA superfamily ATPase
MTNFKIEKFPFNQESISNWGSADPVGIDWPVVYTLSSDKQIYIGETLNATSRLLQHLKTENKQDLARVQIILNSRFNKSACLDLESQLIKLFAADGTHRVLNANSGITDANYFERNSYRESFNELYEILVADGLLSRSIPEIVNSNLFKFSPFKALTTEQAVVVSAITERIISEVKASANAQMIVQGDPGTGKTIVAIYLVKLLKDIALMNGDELAEQESVFSELFTQESAAVIMGLRIGLVVPQQALRKTLQTVFAQTPGLDKSMVLTPFEVADSAEDFDLLIVDEAHRLGQRANQPSAAQNKKYSELNIKLYGTDDPAITQLDWIEKKSKLQLLLLDTAQAVKPADLPLEMTNQLISSAANNHLLYKLTSQMRVTGGTEYLEFVRALFTADPLPRQDFNGYDLRFYEDASMMRSDIVKLNEEHGLARLLAGFAWPWASKRNGLAIDIELDGMQLQWNQTAKDWINSPTSVNEVGSIHTIQGYDLNYAGVIIGNDIGYDPEVQKITFNREHYFDVKGRENNAARGIVYTDEDVLHWVLNIYRVLLTRGIKGTFVYVCDPFLRTLLKDRLFANRA